MGSYNSLEMSVKIGRLTLKNPVLSASGCFGFGEEHRSFFDLNELGGIVVKGTTLKPRQGNPPPRLAETPSGLLNAIGLQNPGVDAVIKKELPLLKDITSPIIVNISGNTPEEYIEIAKRFEEVDLVQALEVNVSCPNVAKGGMAFGTCPKGVETLVKSLKKVTGKTLIIKLSPNVTDIVSIARGAESGGADAVSLINTLLGMAIDINCQRPVLGNITGGLSGPAVKPVALRMVWQVAQRVSIPIIGMGGISSSQDALEFLLAGASAVSIGTASLVDPAVFPRVIKGIEKYMLKRGILNIKDLTGLAQKN